jgi:CheY-like chemotaxis protein
VTEPRCRVLWVDDDGPTRFRYEERFLQGAGVAIDWAVTLQTARKRLRERNYDFILLDMFVPDGSSSQLDPLGGLKLLEQLRRCPEELGNSDLVAIPVAICSGMAPLEEDLAKRGIQNLTWLKKPLDLSKLLGFLGLTVQGPP